MAAEYTVFPYEAPFTYGQLTTWVFDKTPKGIAMNDRQYAYYASAIAKCCPREILGVPLVFLGSGGRVV